MDELEVFVAVVEEQGFSAAAKRLNSTPAAVSGRCKALEQWLACRVQPEEHTHEPGEQKRKLWERTGDTTRFHAPRSVGQAVGARRRLLHRHENQGQ